MRLFVVNYKFVYCGDVFTDGLRHAAEDLGLTYEAGYWNDPDLPEKVYRFAPDLILVVHGRRFAQRWEVSFLGYKTAVWLVDEPYETDDTQRWSGNFDTVFVNDPATLHKHRNAHYLPMCFDPHMHRDVGAERIYKVGFVGNYSPLRQRYLSALADVGLLTYVVGERWRGSTLNKYCIAGNVPAARTAELYQQTEIVINVFRETHHYNAQRIPATSMNPRIYEALACGSAVVSEARSGIPITFPVRQISHSGEFVGIVRDMLTDGEGLERLREQSAPALTGHTYRDRLSTVLRTCLESQDLAA